MVTQADQNLSLDVDPKLAWALANRHYFPVDVNSACREQLLRIPGIGARSVKRLLKIRRFQHIRTCDLKKLKVAWNRAKYFVLTSDHNPALKNLDMLEKGDKVEFEREFEKIAEWFGPFGEQAMRESSFLIDKLIGRF